MGRIRSLKALAEALPTLEFPIRHGRQQREQGLLVSSQEQSRHRAPAEPDAINHFTFSLCCSSETLDTQQRFFLAHSQSQQGGQAIPRTLRHPVGLLGQPEHPTHDPSLGVLASHQLLLLPPVSLPAALTALISTQHPPSSPNPALLEVTGKSHARAGASLPRSRWDEICTLVPQCC